MLQQTANTSVIRKKVIRLLLEQPTEYLITALVRAMAVNVEICKSFCSINYTVYFQRNSFWPLRTFLLIFLHFQIKKLLVNLENTTVTEIIVTVLVSLLMY